MGTIPTIPFNMTSENVLPLSTTMQMVPVSIHMFSRPGKSAVCLLNSTTSVNPSLSGHSLASEPGSIHHSFFLPNRGLVIASVLSW